MATQDVKAWRGNDGVLRHYKVLPVGLFIPPGEYILPPSSNWPLATAAEIAALTTTCHPAQSNPGGPVIGGLTPPAYTAGAYWEWVVPQNTTTTGAGTILAGFGASALPGYISSIATPAGLKLYTPMVIPAGTTGNIPIRLYAEDSAAPPRRTYTTGLVIAAVGVAAAVLIARIDYTHFNRAMVPRLGPQGQALPFVSVRGPQGFTDTTRYQMKEYDVGGGYLYDKSAYTNPPAGLYTFKFEHLGQTKYGQISVGTADFQTAITLSPTDPLTVAPGTPAITQFQLSSTRLSVEEKVTLSIRATGAVRVKVKQDTTTGYDSGFVNAVFVSTVDATLSDYVYTGNDRLPAGSYTARVELISNAAIFETIPFSVGNTASTGFGTPTHYESSIAP